MSDETVKQLHYTRQFLAPEQSRYERANCYSYVYVDSDPDGIQLEAEISISDGYSDVVNFDGTTSSAEEQDAHLAAITVLMEQIIQYRQSYAEALATVRGQSVTGGGTVASVVMRVNGSELKGED